MEYFGAKGCVVECKEFGVKWNKWALSGRGMRYLEFTVTMWWVATTVSYGDICVIPSIACVPTDKGLILEEAEEVNTQHMCL